MNELFDSLPEPKKLVIVEGADHFFTGKLDQMTGAIGAWLDERYPDRIAVLDSKPS
jgi:alpha/beta superfamily hydrolase